MPSVQSTALAIPCAYLALPGTVYCIVSPRDGLPVARTPPPNPPDDFASWATQLRKGIVELMILSLVDRQELYGYAIVRELKERGGLVAGEGTVYPVLRRLESDGLVSAAWSDEGPAGPRKYYRITNAGHAFLERAWAEWDSVSSALGDLGGGSR